MQFKDSNTGNHKTDGFYKNISLDSAPGVEEKYK